MTPPEYPRGRSVELFVAVGIEDPDVSDRTLEVREVMGSETPAGRTIRHLQELKQRAEETGLVGRVVQTSRTTPPVLVVINPYSRSLSEEITCRERGDGGWWLYWS
jgi:hypothetical protein